MNDILDDCAHQSLDARPQNSLMSSNNRHAILNH